MELNAQTGPATDPGSRIIKVNHAGEHGAIYIYSGQIFMARVTARGILEQLREFRSHERRHRALFAAELKRRGRSRCRSYWLCGFGGLTLGLITGLLGLGAIAATTVAVEGVVLKPLEHQLVLLQGIDPGAVSAISAIIVEERQHQDQSASHVHVESFWSRFLTPIVAASTEAVIWLGMRM